MATALIIGVTAYIIGVVLICLEKQRLGTALMILNPIGLIPFTLLSIDVGIFKSLETYFYTLSTIIDE